MSTQKNSHGIPMKTVLRMMKTNAPETAGPLPIAPPETLKRDSESAESKDSSDGVC